MIVPTLACLFAAALLGLLVYGVANQSPSRTLDEAVRTGHWPPAPEARRSLPVLDGDGSESLASYAGKVVILNFWASWCEPCQHEAPLLERAQHTLVAHHATVLGVTYEDNTSDSRSFAHRYGLTYPNLRDVDGEFAHSYGTDQLPETFVIDRRGQVVAISRGEVTSRFLAHAIGVADES